MLHEVITKEENVVIFRRYIAEISCVEGYRHDFSLRNIGQTIFRAKFREIGDLSRYIRDFGEKSTIFLDTSPGQRGSPRYSESQMCYNVPATVPPQTNCFRGVQPSYHLG